MLIAADDADFAALVAGRAPRGLRHPDGGIEHPDVLTMLRDLAGTIAPQFAPSAWLIVADGEIVGLCSLVRPPDGRAIDIGYGIAATRRRRGHAGAAIAALLAMARDDGRIDCVRAETAVANLASQRVLERNGFARTGERIDPEDGALICWECSFIPSSRA